MKNFILSCLSLVFFTAFATAQEFAMTDGNFTTCSGSFTDSGGLTGDYTNGEDAIITFCSPFATDDIQVTFNSFALASGDLLFVYDGDTTTAPLLGVFLGMNSPGAILASAANATGCLTFRFRSDSSNISTGWEATVACIDNCQTITSAVTTIPATDADGITRICQGETVNFTGSPNFSVDGTGATFEYILSDGSIVAGTTASETFTNPGIYRIDFVVTDPTGCRDRSLEDVVIQVSTTPDFTGTQAADTSICFGESTDITGMVETTEFFADVAPPITGQTFLPDGPNDPEYETCIDVTGFNVGTTFQSVTDLNNIFINMEHSWVNDLQIVLTAPDGTMVTLLSNPNAGGGIFFGIPIDPGPGPGTGFLYNFTEAPSATQTIFDALPPLNFGDSVPAGDYLPEDPFSSLIGTPLNGLWCLTITDFLASDDGYIFEWGINFNPAIIPAAGSYEPGEVTEAWAANPDITATNGNVITVTPTASGQQCYDFEFTDSFGCTYVETVCIDVAPEIATAVPNDIIICQSAGPATIDLTSQDTQILNGLDPNLYNLTAFNDAANANAATNAIATPAAYDVSADESVFIRVEEAATGCFNVVQLDINYSTAEYNVAPDLELCDDPINPDGSEPFNLSAQDATVLGSQSPTEFQVNYFTSQADADANMNAITNVGSYDSMGETIYVRVSNIQDPNCFTTGTFNLIVTVTPSIGTAPDIIECDELPADGTKIFDLSVNDAAILNGQSIVDFIISYHTSQADADANANAITNPSSFDSMGQTIFVRLSNIQNLDCFTSGAFDLILNTTPAIGATPDITLCDELPIDGVTLFDLTVNDAAILNGQSTADFIISYHTSQNDADANMNAITNSGSFDSMGETIYVRLSNIQNPDCFSTGAFDLNVNAPPSIGIAPDVTECDQSPIDGATAFDFSVNDTVILNGQAATAFTVTYHDSQSDADAGTGALSPTSIVSGGAIYARIVDNATGCYNTSTFNFIVETCEVEVPEGFSPNNDGINDTFSIPGIDQFANFELKVFNRLGSVVYETKASNYVEFAGIPNAGLNSGDGLLPTGTYFYVIKFNDPDKEDIASWVYINY